MIVKKLIGALAGFYINLDFRILLLITFGFLMDYTYIYSSRYKGFKEQINDISERDQSVSSKPKELGFKRR